jgi:DNA invertase Pin-like site-specific DNA recombinase
MNDDFSLSALWDSDKQLLENIVASGDGEEIRPLRPVSKEYYDYQNTGRSDTQLAKRFQDDYDGKPDTEAIKKRISPAESAARKARARQLHADGKSLEEISRELGISRATINNYVSKDMWAGLKVAK